MIMNHKNNNTLNLIKTHTAIIDKIDFDNEYSLRLRNFDLLNLNYCYYSITTNNKDN